MVGAKPQGARQAEPAGQKRQALKRGTNWQDPAAAYALIGSCSLGAGDLDGAPGTD